MATSKKSKAGKQPVAVKKAAARRPTTTTSAKATTRSAKKATRPPARLRAGATSRQPAQSLVLSVKGIVITGDPKLVRPALLRDDVAPATSRTAREAREAESKSVDFLALRNLREVAVVDLRPASREARAKAETPDEISVEPNHLIALETDDGLVFYTSGAGLLEAARRRVPSAEKDGVLSLDDLARGVARRSGKASTARSGGFLSALSSFATRLWVLASDDAGDAVIDEAREWLKKQGHAKLLEKAEWMTSVMGAKAISYVVEKVRLKHGDAGLYHMHEDGEAMLEEAPVTPQDLAAAAAVGPLLVLLHGTASSTAASFRGLREGSARRDWQALWQHYGGRIYGFEHRTFSASPIENAIELVKALPPGARVDLLTHSRGGLVGDLLGIDWNDEAAIKDRITKFERRVMPEYRDAEADFAPADQDDKDKLTELASLSRERRVTVGRYVRVAAPANGTLLMGTNLDLFLSVLVHVSTLAVGAEANPAVRVAKRIVKDIVRHRCNATVVPGLEAMLPASALSAFLSDAPVAAGLQLGVIAGDTEGTKPNLKRLVEFFTDWAFFDQHPNDLIVDTDSMDEGIARSLSSRLLERAQQAHDAAVAKKPKPTDDPRTAARLPVQGEGVHHFSYFKRPDTRDAMVSWLTARTPVDVPVFESMVARLPAVRSNGRGQERGGAHAGQAKRPTVLLLPGMMGSYLARGPHRLWTGAGQAVRGSALELGYPDAAGKEPIESQAVFEDFYAELIEHLGDSHDVEPFHYDWRLPIQQTAERLVAKLRELAKQPDRWPVRILAHSMGGLVVRAAFALAPDVARKLLDTPGSHVVMLGTPHRGSHAAAGMLFGRHDVLRILALADMARTNSLQEHVDLVARLPGALQLLPRREFLDRDGLVRGADYLSAAFWEGLRMPPDQPPRVVDRIFGNGIVGVPSAQALRDAKKLFALRSFADPDAAFMPVAADDDGKPDAAYTAKFVMVVGKDDATPVALSDQDGVIGLACNGEGDGVVPWVSSRIDGIDHAYAFDVEHSKLCAEPRWFDAIRDLLTTGRTERAPKGWPTAPATRDGSATAPLLVADASPLSWPTHEGILAAAMGGRPTPRGARKARTRGKAYELRVSCSAMDLRDAEWPILVGHYEGDPIAAAEATIDTDVLDGELSMRHHLGQYVGPVGTAAVVVREPTPGKRDRGAHTGAVVVGLGEYGSLTAGGVTQAVRAGCLHYLLVVVDRMGDQANEEAQPPKELGLSSLLIGQNSTTNISIADSVGAVVRGVVEANQEFDRVRSRGQRVRIATLELVEWYRDVAVSATKALQRAAEAVTVDRGEYAGVRVTADKTLRESESMRSRLEAQEALGYWPRLIVTGRVGDRPWREAQAQLVAPVADKLHFLYLSQRARAEATVMQRQPDLLEQFTKAAIDRTENDDALGRTLFQLMVPLEFKDTARQMDRLVLVVDAHTANFPWELLVADERPMIEKLDVVRQFESLTWRPRPRPTSQRTALVVANPSTDGFDKKYPEWTMPDLPSAAAEGEQVVKALKDRDYLVTPVIGEDADAITVMDALFARPYRIVHIAAHGVFELQREGLEGREHLRSGVVLSGGLFLTAAEIRQMELVPDLVFLNCCHLGKADDRDRVPPARRNLLAASLARELIEIGVRAVVVAGWAVDDQAAQTFASAFYREFVGDHRTFGEAVGTARKATLKAHGDTNTWGAYQAYGDPSFVLDPQHRRASHKPRDHAYATPEEAVAQLDLLADALKRKSGQKRYDTLAKVQAAVDEIMKGCPAECREAWQRRGNVLAATAAVYARLGAVGYDLAAKTYLESVGAAASDARSYPSIRAIEQLANFDARAAGKEDVARVERAAARLEKLANTVALDPEVDAGDDSPRPTAEQCGLIGRCMKGIAAFDFANNRQARGEEYLDKAIEKYRRGARPVHRGHQRRYCEINALALEIVAGRKTVTAERFANLVAESKADYWRVAVDDRVDEGLIPVDVEMLQALKSGTLTDKATRDRLVLRYREEGRALEVSKQAWGSVTTQFELLADLTKSRRCPKVVKGQAQALRELKGELAKAAE